MGTLHGQFSWDVLSFGLSSVTSLAALTWWSWKAYGIDYLNNALLYHTTRHDPRHNFSVYFYHIYLTYFDEPGVQSLPVETLAFLQQGILLIAVAWRWAGHLPFCWLITTIAFVAYNKVWL